MDFHSPASSADNAPFRGAKKLAAAATVNSPAHTHTLAAQPSQRCWSPSASGIAVRPALLKVVPETLQVTVHASFAEHHCLVLALAAHHSDEAFDMLSLSAGRALPKNLVRR